ncbi:MAG: CoA transferase [Burkholderiales bacterium]|nr:CoA transferase [Burkholderiales bacterium]
MNPLLEGVTVLDFSEYIAGPLCGLLLADMGARVIKIEPPDGAEERRMGSVERYRGNTRMSLAMNRGKHSLCVDLHQAEGRAIVHRLVAQADVVLQNFVPGAAEKLGVDHDTLSRINPRLVFLSSTAFGEVGPYRKRKGFDIIAHAASGVMSNYADELGAPRGPGGPAYIDIGTGMLNALAIVSALYHRDRTGEGQKIETSLFATGMALQAIGLVQIDRLDAEQHAQEQAILRSARADGKKHTHVVDQFNEMRLRKELPRSARPIEVPDCLHRPTDRQTYPYYRVYETGDGYLSIAALNRKLREKLCAALDIVDPDAHVEAGDIPDEVYFRQKQVMQAIEARLKQQGNAHWLQVLEAAGVPCGQVNYRSDLYTDPQAQALDLVWTLENRDLGPYKAAGHPIRFQKTPVRAGAGAPSLGEHSAAVLREAGYGEDEITRLREAGTVR